MAHSAGVTEPQALVSSGICGLAMAAAAGAGASAMAATAALLAVGAVLVGLWWRVAATIAVLLAIAAIGLGDPPTVSAAVAGLAAVCYLVSRHAGTVTVPMVVFALGFTAAGMVATMFPWSLPWLPLLAPFAAFGIYVVATQPFPGAEW